MKKNLFVIVCTILLISVSNYAFALHTMKAPQGRLGTGYKTEKYKQYTKTNISQKDLEQINKIVKQEENNTKKTSNIKKQEIKQVAVKQTNQITEVKKDNNINKPVFSFVHKNPPSDPRDNQTGIMSTKAPEASVLVNKQEIKKDYLNEITKTPEVTVVKVKQDVMTKSIVDEVSSEITNERTQMLEELSLLWVSAVQKSDTVYFAIMKLSNPNGAEVNKNGIKKILEPIISAAPLVGQAFVNPALTAGSLIGSNVMGTMMNDSASKRLTKVNDADLVILARAIDELQETLLMNYLAYKGALKEYEMSIKITDNRKQIYDKLNEENSPHVVLASTFYTEALDNQYKARQEFLMKRIVLEQMVGTEALNEIEKKTISALPNN